MIHKVLLLTLFSSFVFNLAGQVHFEDHSIHSQSIGTAMQLQVYYPQSYLSITKDYPVVYVLDGQWFFYNGVGIQETLRGENVMPEMIVVGVSFRNRPFRDSLLQVNWKGVVEYVQNEVPEFINDNYRTLKEQVLFGWEQNAAIACEVLLTENSPFLGAIASNGGFANEQMLSNQQAFQGGKKYLFVANSKYDVYTRASGYELVNQLEKHPLNNLEWTFQSFDDEVHESLPYVSLYRGLRYFYHNYSAYIIADTREFTERGGLPELKRYFQERGERFGLDTAVSASTKNMLIWLAWKQDDFESFRYFMNEFEEVLSSRRYASAYWQHRLGSYYLVNDHFQEAIQYFTTGIEQYPDQTFLSAMYAKRGKAFAQLGDLIRAKKDLKTAISIAGEHHEDALEEYKVLLKQLN
tara:strand:+ start:159 stop:1385 length:1227 start_codon:yes stop_codon:yes gene_type:complete